MAARKENYLIIPNSVFNSSLDRKNSLGDDELYLYCWLYRSRLQFEDGWYTLTFIEHIHQFCEMKFASVTEKDKSANKRKIKEILITLQEKGYIKNSHPTSTIDKKLENTTPLFIEFPYADKKGFNANITYSIFDRFDSSLEFFIYAYIDKFGDKGHTISYYEWERVARRSETTIKKVIKKMNTYEYKNKPRIWKFSGDYYMSETGEPRQNENTYYTRPNEEIKKKWNGFYSPKREKERDKHSIKGLNKERSNEQEESWGADDPFENDHFSSLQYETVGEEETAVGSKPVRENPF